MTLSMPASFPLVKGVGVQNGKGRKNGKDLGVVILNWSFGAPILRTLCRIVSLSMSLSQSNICAAKA